MPCKPRKARRLLKENKAIVVKREPFTIRLLYGSSGYKQNITVGLDCGSKNIGISASSEKHELYSSSIEVRNDISKLLKSRSQLRRTRRSKLRYRKARFLNRKSNKKTGWLPPSVQHKIDTHVSVVDYVDSILPVSKIIVETASFDIERMKGIEDKSVITGDNFWNLREMILRRDQHTCQNCNGLSKNKVLQVHHIVFRSFGGTNAPNNLITLCVDCHTPENHNKGEILWDWMENRKKVRNWKDATFMNILKPNIMKSLNKKYDNVEETFGYITKIKRIEKELLKTHQNDAFCISGNLEAEKLDVCFYMKKVRRHNRQIHKVKYSKGHKRKRNQVAYEIYGFRLFDKVSLDKETCFIYGRRKTGYFDVRKLSGEKIKASISHKKLKLISIRGGFLIEKRLIEAYDK